MNIILRLIIITGVTVCFSNCNNNENKTTDTDKKPTALKSRHSLAFNQSVDSVLSAYYDLSDALVRWDSSQIDGKAEKLYQKIGFIKVTETEKADDPKTAVSVIALKATVNSITGEQNLEKKRKRFHTVSDQLFNLLNTFKYDASKLYLHECTMPFNDTGRAVWLSRSDTLRNPYLGMYHPRYGRGMLECGKHISTIDFISKEN